MDCGNLVCIRGGGTKEVLWRYYMNGRSQMQGGKNWILSKEINQTSSSETLIDWKNHLCPSMEPNGGTMAMDSGLKHGGLARIIN
jgi:hypothetical protein